MINLNNKEFEVIVIGAGRTGFHSAMRSVTNSSKKTVLVVTNDTDNEILKEYCKNNLIQPFNFNAK